MPTKRLTDLFVERVKPPARGRSEYFDATFGGLALRVTDRGHKSWSLFYRINGRLRRFTLGSYPALKPAHARRDAQDALNRVNAGFDPIIERVLDRRAALHDGDTFAVALQDYLAQHGRRNLAASTYTETKRMLERDVLPLWHDRLLGSITRREVLAIVDSVADRGAEIQANRTLARLRAFFNWAVQKDRIAVSPVTGLKSPTKERSRDRALSDDELRWLWSACDDDGWPFGPLVKLLILTAQRRDEVGGMEWSEIDFGKQTWTIPIHRAKNGRAHEVQLSGAAMAILKSLPRVNETLVFTSTGTTPISGFSRAERRIDKAMIEARPREHSSPSVAASSGAGGPAPEIPDWIFHDLRRTAATGMAKLGVSPHVVDKILNHVSGKISGVAAIYNRFEYLPERQAALESWGCFVESLVLSPRLKLVSHGGI